MSVRLPLCPRTGDVWGRPERRLRVGPHPPAVAVLSAPPTSPQRGQRRLVEDPGHEAHLLGGSPPAVAPHGDLADPGHSRPATLEQASLARPRPGQTPKTSGVLGRASLGSRSARRRPSASLRRHRQLDLSVNGETRTQSPRLHSALTAPVRAAGRAEAPGREQERGQRSPSRWTLAESLARGAGGECTAPPPPVPLALPRNVLGRLRDPGTGTTALSPQRCLCLLSGRRPPRPRQPALGLARDPGLRGARTLPPGQPKRRMAFPGLPQDLGSALAKVASTVRVLAAGLRRGCRGALGGPRRAAPTRLRGPAAARRAHTARARSNRAVNGLPDAQHGSRGRRGRQGL